MLRTAITADFFLYFLAYCWRILVPGYTNLICCLSHKATRVHTLFECELIAVTEI